MNNHSPAQDFDSERDLHDPEHAEHESEPELELEHDSESDLHAEPEPTSKRKRHKKTSEVPTRIFAYRALASVTEYVAVEQQFKLGHQYRNARVEVERRLITRLRDVVLACLGTQFAQLHYEDACAAVDNAVDDVRGAKSGGGSPTQDQIDHLNACKGLRAEAGGELREAKTTHHEALVPGYEAARKITATERLEARRVFVKQGLRHGTYDRVENSVKQAFQDAQAFARKRGRPVRWPGFERYEGTGSIGTQIIGGISISKLLAGTDTRIRLGTPGQSDAHPRSDVMNAGDWATAMQLPRNLRRHAARTFAWLRIGSNPDRSPIFAQFPITLHRSLPADAVIKWVYVVRRRVGHHLEWSLQFTIESNQFRPLAQPIGEGTCAVDIGWRRIFDPEGNVVGLRAGYVVDDHGREREIRVPDGLLTGMDKVTHLASTRDKEFETARDCLVAWLVKHPTPVWMADQVSSLHQWRAPRKLQALVDRWVGIDWTAWKAACAEKRNNPAEKRKCNPSDYASSAQRVSGDTAIVAMLVAWAKQDRHLQSWQEHQRERLIARRRETWCVIAAELTKTYAKILLEDGKNREGTMKLPEIEGWERPAPEDGDPSDGREQRKMSRLAAPGELRAEILKAAPKRGAIVTPERTEDSTQECAWCHAIARFDAAPTIEHTCASCDRTWDQDANACRNLLHRHGHTSGPVPPPREGDDPDEVTVAPTDTEVPATANLAIPRSNSGGAAHAVLNRAR